MYDILERGGFVVGFSKWMKCHGTATVGERGQVVLPADARKAFNIKPGDKLFVLGADDKGFQRIVLMKTDSVTTFMSRMFDLEKFLKSGGTKELEKMLKAYGVPNTKPSRAKKKK